MELIRIFEGVADQTTALLLFNRYQKTRKSVDGSDQPNPHHGPTLAGQYFEIEAHEYDHFLGSMPPLVMCGGAFVMSEYSTGYLTNSFYEIDGRFFCVTIRVPRGAIDAEDDKINALKAMRDTRKALVAAMN